LIDAMGEFDEENNFEGFDQDFVNNLLSDI
jgi:hypothetical protein